MRFDLNLSSLHFHTQLLEFLWWISHFGVKLFKLCTCTAVQDSDEGVVPTRRSEANLPLPPKTHKHSRLLDFKSAVKSSWLTLNDWGETKEKKKPRQLCEIKQLFGVRKEHGCKRTVCHISLNLHCQICVQLSRYLQHLAAIWTDKVLFLFFFFLNKKKRPADNAPILTQIAAYPHGKTNRKNYNRILVNHIEKHCQAKPKTSKRPIAIHCIYVVL